MVHICNLNTMRGKQRNQNPVQDPPQLHSEFKTKPCLKKTNKLPANRNKKKALCTENANKYNIVESRIEVLQK